MAIPTSRHARKTYHHAIPQKDKDVPQPLSNYLLRVNFSAAQAFNKYRLDASPHSFALVGLDYLHLFESRPTNVL